MSTRIVVGLGNPGPEYESTRHNVGFRVVEKLAGRHALPRWKRSGVRVQTGGEMAGGVVILVKPLTFMNRSGEALARLSRDVPFDPEELLVCYDDFALPLGRLRIRSNGSHGGHNGMRSILERLGTEEVPRLRIGVAPDTGGMSDATDFVLGAFRRRELPIVEEAIERAADAVECVLCDGLTAAMNRYNPKNES